MAGNFRIKLKVEHENYLKRKTGTRCPDWRGSSRRRDRFENKTIKRGQGLPDWSDFDRVTCFWKCSVTSSPESACRQRPPPDISILHFVLLRATELAQQRHSVIQSVRHH